MASHRELEMARQVSTILVQKTLQVRREQALIFAQIEQLKRDQIVLLTLQADLLEQSQLDDITRRLVAI